MDIWSQVPADMVVNAIIAAMVAHANEPGEVIYQVGSSVRNPVRYNDLHDYGFRYFTRKPWINKDGKPVTVHKCTVMSSMDSFRRYMTLRYLLLLKVCIYMTSGYYFITLPLSNMACIQLQVIYPYKPHVIYYLSFRLTNRDWNW